MRKKVGDKKIKIRDLRHKEKLEMDDVYLNEWARYCGANATLVYLSLCRHANFYTQEAFPSQQLIADENNITLRRVRQGFRKLQAFNVIYAKQERNEQGRFKNYVYTLLDKSEWIKLPYSKKPHTGKEAQKEEKHEKQIEKQASKPAVGLAIGGQTAFGESPNKEINYSKSINLQGDKKEIIIAEQSSTAPKGKEINELIDKFKAVNPTYERLFVNKTQREALERLIKKFGIERIGEIIDALPKIFGKPYAPRITTPLQLEQKLADLIAYLKERLEIGSQVFTIKPPKK